MPAISTPLSERRLERTVPLLFRRRTSAKGIQRPHKVHLEYLRGVPFATATKFARSFIRNMHPTGEGWFGASPFMDGYLVEIHEGGSGHPFWPELLAAYGPVSEGAPAQTFVLEVTGARTVVVEFSASGVSCLLLPESVVGFDARKINQADAPLLNYLLVGTIERVALWGTLVAAVSALMTPLALFTRPQAPSLEFVKPMQSSIFARELAPLLEPPVGSEISSLKLDGGKWEAAYKPKENFPKPTLIPSEAPDAAN